jgi:hypothetical protein
MDEITNTVTMSLEDFLEMRDNENNFWALLDAIIDNTTLGYNNSYLVHNDNEINKALAFIAPKRYKRRIAELRRNQEKED